MRSFAPLVLLAGLTNALPQSASPSCVTVTSEVIVPTTTYTFSSTSVTTEHATTAKDLGTFTLVTTISSTSTLETLTTTSTECTETETVTAAGSTTTIYTTAGALTRAAPAPYKRDGASACTATYYSTTTYGATETYVPAGKTSTYTEYTAFSQATVTSTKYGGTAYTIATATATTSAVCGPTVNSTTSTTTVTQDARCAPTALVSEYDGFGLEYTNGPTTGGATYKTTASDAGACCQLCVEAEQCAASTWDIRNNACTLSFPVDSSGHLSCGQGFLVLYDAGPDHPMAPGTGLYVGLGCGSVDYANAPPDDGT